MLQAAGHPGESIAPDKTSAILAWTSLAANEIKLSAPNFLIEFGAHADRQFEFDQRMSADKFQQHFRQPRRDKILRRAES